MIFAVIVPKFRDKINEAMQLAFALVLSSVSFGIQWRKKITLKIINAFWLLFGIKK
jgi:hypothetical protein